MRFNLDIFPMFASFKKLNKLNNVSKKINKGFNKVKEPLYISIFLNI